MINKETQNLIQFTILSSLDRLLIFILPFYVYFLTSDKLLFNDIEYIYSIASLAMIFFELGLKNYLFYGYKINKDKDKFLNEIKLLYNFLILVYTIILIIAFLSTKLINLLIPYFGIRLIFFMLSTFYFSYFRLKDKPSAIFLYTVPVNLLTFVLIYYYTNSNHTLSLCDIYILPFLSIILFNLYQIKNTITKGKNTQYILKALKFSLPVMINLLLMGLINQFGKLYAYNNLDINEMFDLSLIQRISTIIVLIHASIVGFFTKKLFMSKSLVVHKNIFKVYFFAILFTGLSIYLCIIAANKINILDINTYLLNIFLIGTMLWCNNAYFELYFNRSNKNRYIPIISLFAFTAYFISFTLSENINISRIGEIYLLSNLTGSLFTFYFLRKIRLN
tara:strand:+ start:3865 stop:5040 length:1176 start_codon:yes stop_codon:yes gene_type:complete